MSLWRKRNVHHSEQKPDNLSRPWVGLSEKDINELKYNLPDLYYWVDVVRATEKRLKEKNHDMG
jgi:hypothetical protein